VLLSQAKADLERQAGEQCFQRGDLGKAKTLLSSALRTYGRLLHPCASERHQVAGMLADIAVGEQVRLLYEMGGGVLGVEG
jgi:hypothetical protein